MFFKRYIEGLWAMAGGIIYDMFDRDRNGRWTQKPLRRNIGREPVGSSGSATSMSAVTMVPRTRRRSCCGARELITSGTAAGSIIIPDAIKGSRRQTKEFAEDLTAWLSGEKIRTVILDPAAASFRAELEKRWFTQSKESENDVLDGIRFVATLLLSGSIFIDASCENLLKEFASYIWDAKAGDRLGG